MPASAALPASSETWPDSSWIAEESSYIQTDTFAPTDRGKKPYTHSFFTFIPQAGGKLSASLAAYDTDNEITREREIEDITPIANRMIR